VPRNADRPCADATDDDPHVAEGGRIRCYFHHRERHKWETARYRAKTAGDEVSDWDWASDRPKRPVHLRTGRSAGVPPELQADLMRLLDELVEAGRPMLGLTARGMPLAADHADALAGVLNELILKLERLLYSR
jgi:hypothetical protein